MPRKSPIVENSSRLELDVIASLVFNPNTFPPATSNEAKGTRDFSFGISEGVKRIVHDAL